MEIRDLLSRLMPTSPQTKATGIITDLRLRERIVAAERALTRVEVPGYDIDVVRSDVVVKFRVSYDGKRS